MDWLGTEAELQRWQGTARRHHQAGRPILEAATRDRLTGRYPLRPATWDQTALAGSTAGLPNTEGRRDRVRQQDGPDDLGDDDQRRALPRTTTCRRLILRSHAANIS